MAARVASAAAASRPLVTFILLRGLACSGCVCRGRGRDEEREDEREEEREDADMPTDLRPRKPHQRHHDVPGPIPPDPNICALKLTSV